jgi:predicted N-acyltransferase
MSLSAEFLTSLQGIDREQWNGVAGVDYPFLRHEFLLGLEQTGCTTAESGWQPCHLVLRDGPEPVAVMPLYLKSHSYGEYVFDWSWADAWQRSGLQYYPKLLTAIPFTPATGPRLCCTPELDSGDAWRFARLAVQQLAREKEISSWHVLFPEPAVSEDLLQAGLHQRSASQFHWFNQGYTDFDDFLATLTSRKRKSLRRERRRVEEQGLSLRTLTGNAIREEDWDRFHHFYQLTYAKRSGHGGYLTRAFFTQTAASLGDQVLMVLADAGNEPVAGALYFRSCDTLYGRYWGCRQEFDCLHFEACYYQGIEFCIANGLKRFDPGAQGEHKIQRGFQPVKTFSNHWIADPRLSAAVGDFTRQERRHVEDYMSAASTLLPFREL